MLTQSLKDYIDKMLRYNMPQITQECHIEVSKDIPAGNYSDYQHTDDAYYIQVENISGTEEDYLLFYSEEKHRWLLLHKYNTQYDGFFQLMIRPVELHDGDSYWILTPDLTPAEAIYIGEIFLDKHKRHYFAQKTYPHKVHMSYDPTSTKDLRYTCFYSEKEAHAAKQIVLNNKLKANTFALKSAL